MAYDYIFLVQGQTGTGHHIWDIRAVDTVNIAKVFVSWCNILFIWTFKSLFGVA